MFNSKYSVLSIPFKLLGYFLGLFWPRNEKLWAFGAHGGEMFMGNSKYLFLHISNSEYKIEPVWFCRNKDLLETLRDENYNAVHTSSLKGILTALKAGTILYTNAPYDIHGYLTSGARKVNLWHGMPLKKIGLDAGKINEIPIYKIILLTILHKYLENYDVMFTLSEYFNKSFKDSQFRPNTEFIGYGYPRNDALGKKFEGESLMDAQNYKKKVEADQRKIFFYLPTWRERKENPINYSQLDEWLQKNDSLMLVKPHYFESQLEDHQYANLIVLPPYLDIYPMLRHTDILITDYSSVFFDFLLLDKPIIFFPYDYEYYKRERGFERDYDFFTPGPQANNFEELLDIMEKTLDKDTFKDKRHKIREKTFDYPDFESCTRIVNELNQR